MLAAALLDRSRTDHNTTTLVLTLSCSQSLANMLIAVEGELFESFFYGWLLKVDKLRVFLIADLLIIGKTKS